MLLVVPGIIRNRNSSDTYFTQFLWNILHVDIGTHSSTCLLNTANTVLMFLVANQLLYHKVQILNTTNHH